MMNPFRLRPRALRAFADKARPSLRGFGADARGSAAIEFGFVGMALVTMLLAILQFGLLFLAEARLHDTLANVATGSSMAQQNDRAAIISQICEAVILAADPCAQVTLVEKASVGTYGTAAQPITGASFSPGGSGEAVLLRAEVPLLSFVPGLPNLKVRGAAVYVLP